MINLTMFSTDEDLCRLTGLDEEGLWDNGFNIDDWNVGFVSDIPLTIPEEGNIHDDPDDYEDPVDGADWLVNRMRAFCVGYTHTEYGGKHYYIVHHA